MSFTSKLIKSRNHLIQLITGKNGGMDAWWILKAEPQKFEVFKAKIAAGIVGNLDNYGEVIFKGWGKTAPADIMKKVEEVYS